MNEVDQTIKLNWSWKNEFGNHFRGKSVLVTGATGFIGSHLSEVLLSLGAVVYGIGLPCHYSKIVPGVDYLEADLIHDEIIIQRLLTDISPSFIYHLAGLVDTRQDIEMVIPTLENNLIGSIKLLIALTKVSCERIIITGSSEAPINRYYPNSPYAASKLALIGYANMFNKLYGLPVAVARPFMCFGPHQPKDKLISSVILSIINGHAPKLSSGERICDLIYINDMVRGLLWMAINENSVGQILDLGMGVGFTIREIVGVISELMNSEFPPEFGILSDRIYDFPQIANLSDTTNIIGWKPLWTLNEAVVETINWYKKNPI